MQPVQCVVRNMPLSKGSRLEDTNFDELTIEDMQNIADELEIEADNIQYQLDLYHARETHTEEEKLWAARANYAKTCRRRDVSYIRKQIKREKGRAE